MTLRPVRVRLVSCATVSALLWTMFGAAVAMAQTDAHARRPWVYTAETAGVFGGGWLTGDDAPDVTGGIGGVLALGVFRNTSHRTALGVVVRGAMQSLSIQELDQTWSGGTLVEGQLLGSLSLQLPTRGSMRPQLDAGAGLTLLSGTRTVFPFSSAGRIAPMADIGMALGRGQVDGSYLVFARYGVVRMDPAKAPGDRTEVLDATAGYVGRVTIGLRVVR